jgi:hypothetical protein
LFVKALGVKIYHLKVFWPKAKYDLIAFFLGNIAFLLAFSKKIISCDDFKGSQFVVVQWHGASFVGVKYLRLNDARCMLDDQG